MVPNPNDVDPYKFAWDLKTPCSDCPFLRSTPCHSGIAEGLVDMAKHYVENHQPIRIHMRGKGWITL
jgi:hypothetical protein